MIFNNRLQLNFQLTDTQMDVLASTAPIIWMIGSKGEGKTFTGFLKMLTISSRIGNEVANCLVIRDSFTNIERHTIPSFKKAIKYIANNCIVNGTKQDAKDFIALFKWSDGYRKLDTPNLHVDFLGVSNAADIDKLQGGEKVFILIEEPAPVGDESTQGIPEELFNVAVISSSRQDERAQTLMITMNPADESHWTYEKAIENPAKATPESPYLYAEVFRTVYGENEFLSDKQRGMVRESYKDDAGSYARFVEGRFAPVLQGVQVTPEYNPAIHRSPIDLEPIRRVRGYRFWDAGHDPVCIIAQINPASGRLQVYDTLALHNVGTRQLIENEVIPLMNTKYKGITEWVDCGDPALVTRSQDDINMSPANSIRALLGSNYSGGAVKWGTRINCIKHVLIKSPMLLLSHNEKILHKGLSGGWHYAKNQSGMILRDEAVKNDSSHPCDALTQGLAIVLGNIFNTEKQQLAIAWNKAESQKQKGGWI